MALHAPPLMPGIENITVHSGHSAQESPLGIEEARRLLLGNLKN
jgi:hypothetical protein